MNFFIRFIKGICMGAGAIAPGVSGGSLAVIFGIYERLTEFIANAFKNFKKNFIFFLPIGLGGVVGVLGFSRIMEYLFANHGIEVKYLFIGLILGTFPMIFRDANKKGFKPSYCGFLAASLVITLAFAWMGATVQNAGQAEPNFALLILYGAILGFGTIIPGISASFVLMILGGYDTILSAISNVNIMHLLPVGIGFILSIVAFAKLINLFFKKAYGATHYVIIGFVIGSIFPIFPGFTFDVRHILSVILLIGGFFFSYFLGNIGKKANMEVL